MLSCIRTEINKRLITRKSVNYLPPFCTDSCNEASIAVIRSKVDRASKGLTSDTNLSVGDDDDIVGGKNAFCC